MVFNRLAVEVTKLSTQHDQSTNKMFLFIAESIELLADMESINCW